VSVAINQHRIDWVDTAKGIGIVLVVYGHVARGVFNAGLYGDKVSFNLVDNIIYSFHMPLFFFLSGLFFVSSFNKRGSRLILSKVDSIFYAYIVWSFIQGLLEVVMSNYTNGNVSIHDVVVLLWHPRAQFWFLYTLFFVFFFNTIVFFILQKLNCQKLRVWIVLAISAVLLLIKPLLPGYFFLQSLASYDVYFCLGVLFLNEWQGYKIGKGSALCIVAGFAMLEYLTYVNGSISADSTLLKLLLAVIGIAVIVVFCQQVGGIISRAFAYLGVFSMEIYLMHVIFSSGIRAVMQKILGVDAIGVYLIVGTIAGLVLPILFVKLSSTIQLGFLFKPPSFLSVSGLGLKRQ